MHLLLSGEGASDIGVCYPADEKCQSDVFQPGPMAWIVDQCVEHYQGYELSYIENGLIFFVSESYLANNKPPARSMRVPGKKKPTETSYFYHNARALAHAAKSISETVDDVIIAVLFRDADGTASKGRGHWRRKYISMLEGFDAEDFGLGVPMLAKPKSEAWLLCAMKPKSPYQHCAVLEQASGNDDSPNSLKNQLNAACQGKTSAEELADAAKTGYIQWERIDMPSLNAFKDRLEDVVRRARQYKAER